MSVRLRTLEATMAGRQNKGYLTCIGVVVVLVGLVSTVTCDDPCQSNLLTLRDYQYRDINFNPSDPDNWENICDTDTIVTSEWYRMSPANNQRMSEKCPNIGSCGTVYPIWLGGTHPTDDNIKQMKVYMNFRDNCKYWDPDSDNTVSVKRCVAGGEYFYIYRIPDPPFCDSGYCTQNVTSGSPDPSTTTTTTTTTTSTTTTTTTPTTTTTTTPTTTTTTTPTTTTTTTTTTPSCTGIKDPNRDGECLSSHPSIEGRPTIEGPYLEADQPAIYCTIPYSGHDVMTRERFYVRFRIGEYSTEEIETGKDHLRVKLPHEALVGRMGKVVSCEVTSAWSFRSYDRQPYVTSSNNYFVGIQVHNNRIDVREADESPIEIWPYATLPVTCPTPTPRCSVSLRLVPESPDLKSAFICRYSISRSGWNNATRTAKGKNPVTLKARTSPLYSGRKKAFRIQFLKQQLEPGHIWNGYTVAPITVNYYDSPYGLCKIELDSYVTTFDKRQYLFPGKGELWVLRSSAKRIYEVQIRTMTSRRCFGGRPCVCAVAVREGNEVAILDTCNDYVSGDVILPRTTIYRYRAIGGKGLKVTRDGPGKRFSFNLPSGAHVVADVKTYGLDLFVHTTSEDYGMTSGLCGSYDGNPGNDPNLNAMSDVSRFRIKQFRSYFDKKPEQTAIDPVPVDFCTCTDADTISCGSGELVDPASYTGSPGVNEVGPPGSDADVLVKIDELTGSADDDEPAEDPDAAYREGDKRLQWSYHFDYGTDYTPRTAGTTWPTPSGIREQEARTKCETALRKLPFYLSCKNAVGIKDEEVLTKCVSAIQRIDDPDIAALTLSSYEHQCFFDASSQEKLRRRTADGAMGVPDQSLFSAMCPGNCNGHGICSGQRCRCDREYRASDCSLPANQRPTIHAVIGGNTCDVRERPCQRVGFLVSNATDESSLTCRVTFVDTNGKRGKSYETKATLRTWTEVVCELPDSPLLTNENDDANHVIDARHYWSVEISNDGESYTDGGNLTVWDSKCLGRASGNHYLLKVDTCLIDNRCYARNEGNPTAAFCSRCDPSVSRTRFTPITENNPPVLRGPFTIYKLRYDDYNSYLLATDPDGQTEFSYSLDSSLAVSGISLTSRGLLHVSNEVRRDVSIPVKVTDVCGASDSQVFRIRTLDCGCVATSRCTEQLFRIRSHQYRCECVAGSCSAQATEDCLSPACPERVLCQPSLYRSGYDCQCRTRARESRCSLDGVRVWSEWQDWSACSKPCDYGIRKRIRTCLGCVTPDTEVELCNRRTCPELIKEKPEGVIVKVQVSNNKKAELVLTKQYNVLDIIRQSINIICTQDPTSCCQKDVWLNPRSMYNFVSPDDIWLASGYPQVNWDENLLSLKILATISNSAYQRYCDASTRHKRAASSSTHYIPGDIIKEAVSDSISNLEEDIGFRVIEVYKPAAPAQRSWIPYAVGAAGLIVIAIIVMIIIIAVRRRKQNQRRRKAKGNSVPRVQGRDNIPEQGEISGQTGYASLQSGRSRYSNGVRNSQHVYEVPDTDYQRLGDTRSGMAHSHYESIRQ